MSKILGCTDATNIVNFVNWVKGTHWHLKAIVSNIAEHCKRLQVV